jgi:fumarate hydratase subunit beta
VYVARDAAHKVLVKAIESGNQLPFDMAGAVIYYAGPTPERPGRPVGSIGPTTSYRMDAYVEPLLQLGLRGMIGKGVRSAQVRQLLVSYGAVYLVATGGAGAILASRVRKSQVIAYPELGPEALRLVEMDEFPVYVACDAMGGDMSEAEQSRYRRG